MDVCHLYDMGPDYIVLEYVEGENLRGPMSFGPGVRTDDWAERARY